MPRWNNKISTRGPRRSLGRASATARAIPAPRSVPFRLPRYIPPPPRGAIPAAALLVGAGLLFRYLSKEDPLPPGSEQRPDGVYLHGAIVRDNKKDGKFFTKRILYGTVQERDELWTKLVMDAPYEQEWYGEKGQAFNLPTWEPTEIFPPAYNLPARRSYVAPLPLPHERPQAFLPPVIPHPNRYSIPGYINVGEGDDRVVSQPVPIPVPTDRPNVVTSVAVTPTAVKAVPAMTPAPEIKTHTAGIHGVVTAFFSLGGEVIDFTRCFIFAVGFTYTNRNGVEKPIPRSQWMEYLNREAALRSNPYIQGGMDRKISEGVEKKHRRYTDRYTPQEKAERLVKCLIENHIEDAVIGMSSRAKRDFANHLGMNAGLLGIDSQLALADGRLPWADLLG